MSVVEKVALLLRILLTLITEAIFNCIPNCVRRKKDVSKDIVLITGGGSGFGRLLAQRFAQLGSTVIIWDINEHCLDETRKEIELSGGKCYSYVCDVSDRNDVYAKAKVVQKEVGHVTILVNNAGVLQSNPVLALNDDSIERTFKVNMLSHFWTCKAFLPSMLNFNSGHVVSIASIGGVNGFPKISDYCASKASAINFMETLQMELHFAGKNHVNLTTICPIPMRTAMMDNTNPTLIVDTDFAADRTVNAILRDENFVIIPNCFYLGFVLKPFLPRKVFPLLAEFLDVNNIFNTNDSSNK